MNTQLQLPQHPNTKQRKKNIRWAFVVIVGLQLATIAVLLLPKNKLPSADTAYLQKTAIKLEEMNLRGAAVDIWLQYIAKTSMDDDKRATLYLRVARLLQNDMQHEKAAKYFVLCQRLEKNEETKRQIAQYLSDSLGEMKRFSAMDDVVKEQVEFGYEKKAKEALAQIGNVEIYSDDVQKIVTQQIATKTNLMRLAFPQMSQNTQLLEGMHKQYETAEGKKAALEEYLFHEVLWRKAIEDGLHEENSHKKSMKSIAKRLLVQEILQREVNRQIVVLPDEITSYYQQNSAQFVTSAFARVTVKDFAEEEMANQATLEPEEQEKAITITAETKTIEGIGDISAIVSDIFSVTPSGKTVYTVGEKFVRVWIHEKEKQKQQSLEEVREQIQSQIYQKKYQMIMQQFMQQLYNKYNVEVFSKQNQEPQTKK